MGGKSPPFIEGKMVQQFLGKIAWDEVGQSAMNSLASNAVGSIMGLFGSKSNAAANARAAAQLQYQHNLKLQKQAQQWNEYMYKNRYSMQVEDLQNAGINPLFGMGQAPTVTSGMNSVGMADMVGEQNNKFNQLLGLLDFGQNLSAKRAQIKLTEKQAQTEEQNTLLKTAEVLEKQIQNEYLPAQRKAELKKMHADTLETLAKINKTYAETKLTGAQTARVNLENKPLERYEAFVKKNPELAKIIEQLDKTGTTGKAFTNILKQGGTGLRMLLNK